MKLSIKILFMITIVSLLLVGCKANEAETENTIVETLPNTKSSQELTVNTPETFTTTVFKNVNIITMLDDQVLVNYTVVIKEGFITEIGETDSVAIPEGAQVIEGSGHYLMPGFVDMHVHIGSFRHEEPLYLANGVTSVMNMWGRPDILATRDINNKRNLGLRLFTTGPLMDGPNPIWNNSMVLATTEEVSAAVKKVKEQGYDAVKVYELLSLDVYREIMKVAQEIDIKVMGHVPRAVGLKEVLQQKQSSIEHLSGYTELELEEMVEMTALYHVWNTPTLAIDHILQDEGDIKGSEFVHPDTLKGWQRMKAVANYKNSIESLGNRQSLVQTIHLKGGRLLAGTDANNPFVVPGFSLHSELEYLAGAGLRPYEVLKTATFNPAEFLGEVDKMGTVEVGKYADLILLSENPLVDIRNTQSIRGTMIRGVWKDSQALNEELQKLKENF